MSVYASFIAGVKYTSTDLTQRDRDFITNGVVSSGDLIVSQTDTPSMGIKITGAPLGATGGSAWVNGYRVHNDTNTILTIDNADITNSRIDLVVIGIDITTEPNFTPILKVIKGTPSISPVAPLIPGTLIAIELAEINIGANATEILDINITDKRTIANLQGNLHKYLSGSDLHNAKARTGDGDPNNIITPSIAGELYGDINIGDLYLAKSTSNTSWEKQARDNKIGILSNLLTNAKDNLVSAVNSVYNLFGDLAGVGRTNETVKGNADALASHLAETASNDVHDLLSDGKIIEEVGSNANGRYVRFADGTQICYTSFVISSLEITNAWGSLYRTVLQTWVIPATFNFGEFVICGIVGGSSLQAWITGYQIGDASNAKYYINSAISVTNSARVSLIAIGRWK